MVPVDEEGEELDEDHEIFEDFIDDPQDLFGKEINFIVKIGKVKFSVENYENLFISFNLKLLDANEEIEEKHFHTNILKGDKKEDNFQYQKQFQYKKFSQKVLNYLLNSNLCLEIRGTPKL